ncbi:MAG: P-II family nitrogen regulator [Methanoregulaceae archaeon]|nr:P-II family nitrogen regulator [Methanoregulaceae archaeon]
MKLVMAIIRPERVDFVKRALEDLGLFGMTITEVMGRGAQRGITIPRRGGAILVEFLPKVEIECVVTDEQTESVVGAIERASRTGKVGDGMIYIIPIERSIRVRTGEVEV